MTKKAFHCQAVNHEGPRGPIPADFRRVITLDVTDEGTKKRFARLAEEDASVYLIALGVSNGTVPYHVCSACHIRALDTARPTVMEGQEPLL